MARKNKLDPAKQTATATIGIATIHRDYRLAHFINHNLGINLISEDDLPVYNSKTDKLSYFPFFICHHQDLRTDFCLIANHNGEIAMLQSLKQLNYFFILEGAAYSNHVKEIIGQLRKIPGIQAAIPIDQAGLKDFPSILEDLELHRVALQKKQEDKTDKLYRSEKE
jgi:hypothetical protein